MSKYLDYNGLAYFKRQLSGYRLETGVSLTAENVSAQSGYQLYVVPVKVGQKVKVTPGSAWYRVAVTKSYAVGPIDWATGETGLHSSGTDPWEATISGDAKYLLISGLSGSSDRTPSHVYIDGADLLLELKDQIRENATDIAGISATVETLGDGIPEVTRYDNIFDPSTVLEGYILDTSGGDVHTSSSYYTSAYIPVTAGASYKSNHQIRRGCWYTSAGSAISTFETTDAGTAVTAPSNAAKVRLSVTNSVIPSTMHFGDVTKEWDTPFGVAKIEVDGTRLALYTDIADQPVNIFEGKNLAIFGDSAATPTEWPQRLGVALGVARCDLYVGSGYTWRNRYSSGQLYMCMGKLVSQMLDSGHEYDIIIFQIGGNDNSGTTEELGSVDTAFDSYNYMDYEDSETTAECVRYYLEKIRRAFPNALMVVGTVFQRIGTGSKTGESAKKINDILRDSCKRMAIQIVDGETECGFSVFTEPCSPYYNDGNPGVAGDRTSLSRENPIYNYVHTATGEIVDYSTATNGGVLRDGYEKRYGLYTYDGKHQNLRGENKVLDFWFSSLKSLYQSDNLQNEISNG